MDHSSFVDRANYIINITLIYDDNCILTDGGCPRGVMVKAMDYGIVVREFVLQSRYYVHFREDKGVHTFPKCICPKVNVIARLGYKLAYYDFAVHRFNHYTTRTPHRPKTSITR